MTVEAALLSSIPAAAALYLTTYGPGQAWWRGVPSGLPSAFARLVTSLLWTTLVGLVLAATETFSLPRLVAVNGLVALAGYLARRGRPRGGGVRDMIGPLVLAATILAAWPPYAPFVAGADATGYVASGIHLARHHRLWKHDPVAARLSPMARRLSFPSARGRPWQPPYTRMLGGMVIDTPDDSTVRPSFFPVPMVWAAVFADALGARRVAAFAPLFAGAALWAMWLVARRRMPAWPALAAVGLAGGSAAGVWIARMPLADPIAWALLWAGLAATDAWMEGRSRADGVLAGLALGGACLTRIEYALFVVLAFAVWSLWGGFRRWAAAAPIIALSAMLAATAAQQVWLPGAYTAPFAEVWSGIVYRWTPVVSGHLPLVVLGGLAAVAAVAWLLRALGTERGLSLALLAGVSVVYVSYTHPRPDRSLPWLLAYLGWPALLLAPLGLYLLWRRREREPGNGLLLALGLVTSAVILYNPRVLPVHPWAIRRFIPVILPVAILAAALAANRLSHLLADAVGALASNQTAADPPPSPVATRLSAARWTLRAGSQLGTLLVWAGVAAGILLPARAIWNSHYYRGSYEQLAGLAEKIGPGTVTLLDTRLAGHVLATPLWLLYDRNSVPVYAVSRQRRNVIAGLTRALSNQWNVLLLVPAATDLKPIPWTRATRAFDYAIDIEIPDIATKGPPRRSRRLLTHLAAYRLEPIRFPPHRVAAPPASSAADERPGAPVRPGQSR